jgi:hypothetical protein
MNKIFKFFAMGVLVCTLAACGKDDKEPDVPLIPAFVSVEASDASILLLGNADSMEITVKTNRALEVAVSDAAKDWLTVKVGATDATASTAKLILTVTKNEAAFKGRSATVSIAALPSRDGDNVSSASAKGSFEVKQSLFGLPVADLFDWKVDAAGNVSDVSANKMAITVGPAKPATAFSSEYGLYEATISEISSEEYAADHVLFPGNKDYVKYASEEYTAGDGISHKVDSKRMSFYKIPWSTNAGIVKAYQSTFTYELIYRAVKTTDFANNNLFGNVNPTHCGFGIQQYNNVIAFTYHPSFGETKRVTRQAEINGELKDTAIIADRYYHVVATYDKGSSTELIALYVDGVKVGGSKDDNINCQLHFPTDYYAMSTGHTHADSDRTPNTEYLCIGGGSHQSGYPSFGAPHGTKVVVARVYGHALTQAEVLALYNYHKPE